MVEIISRRLKFGGVALRGASDYQWLEAESTRDMGSTGLFRDHMANIRLMMDQIGERTGMTGFKWYRAEPDGFSMESEVTLPAPSAQKVVIKIDEWPGIRVTLSTGPLSKDTLKDMPAARAAMQKVIGALEVLRMKNGRLLRRYADTPGSQYPGF